MELIDTERVEVRIIEHATGLLRTAHDRKRRGCITHSVDTPSSGAQISQIRHSGQPIEFRKKVAQKRVPRLVPAGVLGFLPFGNNLVSCVAARAQRSRAGPSIAPGPWKSACGDVRGPWRGCARASVSWFGSEVLRVNPWFLCVPATRTPGCTAQCNLRLSHANNYIDHRNDGNDRELLPFAVRSASSI